MVSRAICSLVQWHLDTLVSPSITCQPPSMLAERRPSLFFFQAEDGIRDHCVTGVQTCALPISVLAVARTLALAIVTDGEGASKLVEIQVVGAVSEASARDVGRAIARSTLVKTAIYGADPNWGRILAAAGAAGVALAVDRLTLEAAEDEIGRAHV